VLKSPHYAKPQTVTSNVIFVNMTKFRHTKFLCLVLAEVLIFGLLGFCPAPSDRILNIQNNLITVSGIFSGILIAYLFSKLFNIKQERALRQVVINQLSDKLTTFRKLLYCILKSDSFWTRYKDIAAFKKKYPGLNYSRLHDQQTTDDLRNNYYSNEKELSSTSIDLYLAMEEITGNIDEYWRLNIYDRNTKYSYSLNKLNQYYDPSNQIWYYLDYKYSKHTNGLIDDKKISIQYKEKIRELYSELDAKYKTRDFDRLLIAEIATEFYDLHIPQLRSLTRINTSKLPRNVLKIFLNLVLVFVIGVICPLFLQSLLINDDLNVILTSASVGFVILCFTNFLFDLYLLLSEEIQPE
jgi:hypothetical protein